MGAAEFDVPTIYLTDHIAVHGQIGEHWTVVREEPGRKLTQSDRGVHVDSENYHEVYPWASILKAVNVPERKKK